MICKRPTLENHQKAKINRPRIDRAAASASGLGRQVSGVAIFNGRACAPPDTKCSTTGICHFGGALKNRVLSRVGAFRSCNKRAKWRSRNRFCRSRRRTSSGSKVRPGAGRATTSPPSFRPTARLIYFKILNLSRGRVTFGEFGISRS